MQLCQQLLTNVELCSSSKLSAFARGNDTMMMSSSSTNRICTGSICYMLDEVVALVAKALYSACKSGRACERAEFG